MYAKSLYEHTIQGVGKKKLKVSFYRRYMFLDKKDDENDEDYQSNEKVTDEK